MHFNEFFIVILISFVSYSGLTQEFSFPLYFEDASGAKDTIIYGYDEDASDGIDSVFGEENLINKISDSTFTV